MTTIIFSKVILLSCLNFSSPVSSDVKRGQNLEAEARAMRPRPEQRGRGWGWGQCLEVEAKAEAKKYQIVINNIRFEIIAGKINKIPEFNTIFAWKMPDYIIRQRDRG